MIGKADVSIVSPSSERIEKLWVLLRVWRSFAIGGNIVTWICESINDMRGVHWFVRIEFCTGPQMIPKLYRKWYQDRKRSRNANDLHFGLQMIPKKKWGVAWSMECSEQRINVMTAFIKITLNHGSHRFLPHYSFAERLNFVSYHAVINFPHLIIGHNHQKLTWTQF